MRALTRRSENASTERHGSRRISQLSKLNMGASEDHTSKTAHIRKGVFDMFRGILKLTLCLCLGAAAMPAALAQSAAPITEQEAHAIAVDAYVYFYSIMSMDVSRKQFTNGTTDFKGPMNTFVNIPEYPPATMRIVVRPNFASTRFR